MSGPMQNFNNDQMLRMGLATEKDTGSAGTLSISNKAFAVFEIVTAGAESRALDPAANFGVGSEALVVLKTAGGALTVTGAQANVVLSAAGDMALFQVGISGTTKVWRLMSYTAAQLAKVNFSTAPVNVTGSKGANAALTSLMTALAALGLVTDSTS